MLNSSDNRFVTSEQEIVPVNPNRVGMYLTPAERAQMQRVAEQFARSGVEGLLDKDGSVIVKALIKHWLHQSIAALDAPAAVASAGALTDALKPFALTDDEYFELSAFEDGELIFMRPDDGKDSVQNAWRKEVTVGDVRRARRFVDKRGETHA